MTAPTLTERARAVTYSDELTKVRSDLGDGGWSLHAHRLDAGVEDSQAEYPILVSGESSTNADGVWTRPNAADYADARAKLAALRAKVAP